jgi:hypothetical protein
MIDEDCPFTVTPSSVSVKPIARVAISANATATRGMNKKIGLR